MSGCAELDGPSKHVDLNRPNTSLQPTPLRGAAELGRFVFVYSRQK